MVTSSIALEARHKVLLVDDDPVSLELMGMLLAHEGHQVLRAGDAGDAMELLSGPDAATPDVLLVDLQMPGISGSELAEKVRAMRTRAHRPLLLAMSATEANRQQLDAFDGFLLKPFALDDLRRAMNPRKRSRKTSLRVVPSQARSAPPSAEAEVIDLAVVDKLLTMMPAEALGNVITACIADTRACISTLQDQAHAGNLKFLRETAHRIKGAAAMIGATRIARLAGGLESGGDKEAATRSVLDDLLNACVELEGMLLAGKFKKTRAPHHESTNRDNAVNT